MAKVAVKSRVLQDLARRCDQHGAAADELIAAARGRITDGAGRAKDRPLQLPGLRGRDQCAAAGIALHHQHASGKRPEQAGCGSGNDGDARECRAGKTLSRVPPTRNRCTSGARCPRIAASRPLTYTATAAPLTASAASWTAESTPARGRWPRSHPRRQDGCRTHGRFPAHWRSGGVTRRLRVMGAPMTDAGPRHTGRRVRTSMLSTQLENLAPSSR